MKTGELLFNNEVWNTALFKQSFLFTGCRPQQPSAQFRLADNNR